MDLGLMQEVCACVHAHVCVYVVMRARRGTRYWVNTDQSLDISRYMCQCVCVCVSVRKFATSCVPVCLHVGMCVSDRDIRAI